MLRLTIILLRPTYQGFCSDILPPQQSPGKQEGGAVDLKHIFYQLTLSLNLKSI